MSTMLLLGPPEEVFHRNLEARYRLSLDDPNITHRKSRLKLRFDLPSFSKTLYLRGPTVTVTSMNKLEPVDPALLNTLIALSPLVLAILMVLLLLVPLPLYACERMLCEHTR